MTDLKVIETAAMALPPEDRERLALHLLQSLDDLEDVENEGYSTDEGELRYKVHGEPFLSHRHG